MPLAAPRRCGKSRQPNARNSTPTSASPAPTGMKSNIWNGCPVSSLRTADANRLGEVPISVIEPPSSDAKDSGIRNSEGERLLRRATWIAAGIKIASAPTFFIKADSTATQATSTPTWESRVCIIGPSRRSSTSIAPDWPIATLTISAAPISGRTGLAKPLKALSAGTMPAATAAKSANSATTS